LDGKVPTRKATFSRLSSSSATRTASAGFAVVVAAHDLDLLAQNAARGVDLLDRHLPALLVGFQEGREDLVAVELADLDGVPAPKPAGRTTRPPARQHW